MTASAGTASAGAPGDADDARVASVAKELVAFRSVLRGQGELVLGGRVVLLGDDDDAEVVARALLAIGVQELTLAADHPAARVVAAELLGDRSRDVAVAAGPALLVKWQSAHGVVDARPASADAGSDVLPLDRGLLAHGAWVVRCRRSAPGGPLLVTQAYA
ncbi:hypothetical protein N1027_03725 [Herbiconiux sp. CPCC 205763]|uniref:Uncharacterized protein n=1 Tax=Herbiconiux aconitum TaxID=2970913 RepID=A0ABT2GNR7_9MICO|nr:hypothetical protein [Herbiconiux aconitum]MCS5717242.1 hypothetical protein [Herbiconiux aconitum]